ncbi:MAG: TetR family transcriptional regulator C-terminal domain-containing protein [Chitinophagales bacterium]|nr:TetR family transcriptional regulator C-terminal domain-containing protein [Chitinophagales bacterium]
MSNKYQYKSFVEEQKRLPHSLNEINVDTNQYSGILELEREIWKDYVKETVHHCVADPVFESYVAREKMLAFVYTLLLNLSNDELQIDLQIRRLSKWWTSPKLKDFKTEFLSFADELIFEGQDRGEIQKRMFLNKIYPSLFWNTLLLILIFWSSDESQQKEQTDVAVDKWVNLLFDALAPNAIDSAVDLAQFIVKSRMNGFSK